MKIVIVDVREPSEYSAGHVDGAINLPMTELVVGTHKLDEIAKDTPLVLYCRSGNRSGVAAKIIKNLGFTNVSNGINQENVEKLLFTA